MTTLSLSRALHRLCTGAARDCDAVHCRAQGCAPYYVASNWSQGRLHMGLKREHEKILKTHRFEHAGTLGEALERDEFDDLRVIYAITDPGKREIIYIGETEQGRNMRGRLNAHLKDREKINLVENDSDLYVHVMVTEFRVLSDFEEITGGLPACNKRKAMKFA